MRSDVIDHERVACFQFKESALARQSLYRKFDPLVKGAPSPRKCTHLVIRLHVMLDLITCPNVMLDLITCVLCLQLFKKQQKRAHLSPKHLPIGKLVPSLKHLPIGKLLHVSPKHLR